MTISLRDRSVSARVAFTAALCGAALVLHWLQHHFIGSRLPFVFFLVALALVTVAAGRSYALVVLAVGLVNGLLMLPPTGSPMVADTVDRMTMLVFAVLGSLLMFLGERAVRATRRALEAERRLSIAQENTGVGLFDVDLRERTIFASPSLMKLFGRQPYSNERGQVMSLDEWNAGMPREEVEATRALLRRQLATGASAWEYDYKMVLPDGQERWLHAKVHVERDHDGRAIRLRGAVLDVTERKRTMAVLARTQTELTQQVADLQRLHALSARVAELDELHAQLRLILQTLMGFTGAHKGLVSLFDPAAGHLAIKVEIGFGGRPENLSWLVEGRLACGQAYAEKRRVQINDISTDPAFAPLRRLIEEHRLHAAHCTPMLSASGDVRGVLSLYFSETHAPTERELRLADICADQATVLVERARAQAAARDIDQRFRLALDSSAVPFSLMAPMREANGRIRGLRWIYVNSAAERALHAEAGALVGQSLAEVVGGDDVAELQAQLAAVAELGESRAFEQYLKAGPIDGWFHVIASPLQGAVAVWFADVSQRKRDEHALQDADRRKDEFLATLAHELRNPLAPIRQAVTIARMPGASETQRRWSHDVIERQVQHMALLLDDLLDVSRITRGMLQLRKAPAALSDIVDAAVETARPLIDARGHRLLIDIPPAVRFEADSLRVSQILGNLLTNAARYTDPGGTIRVNAERRAGELRICVSDNGIGIARDKLDSVFEMFSQVRPARDHTGGLGIGLALAKGLAELHGGGLEAASDGPGRGSRFTLRLPLQLSALPQPEPREEDEQTRRARRILVADDNRDAAETLAEFLRLEGHAVQVAYDGLEALAGIKSFAPEVALLDIGMPGLSGNEVARRARVTDAGRRAALVAVTGWGQDKDRAQALASGFGHHLTKPVDLGRLRKLLEEL